jgi:hypothetical protein
MEDKGTKKKKEKQKMTEDELAQPQYSSICR